MVRARKPQAPPGAVPDPRGGPRQGAPGKAYGNRSDLTAAPAAPTQPVKVATGQAYGVAGAQAASQAAVPLPQTSPAAGAGAAHAAADAYQMPAVGAFDRPTERPDEALTHGAPAGPGAGPEVMPGMGGPVGMSGVLRQIAGAVGSSDLEQLAARAESLGH